MKLICFSVKKSWYRNIYRINVDHTFSSTINVTSTFLKSTHEYSNWIHVDLALITCWLPSVQNMHVIRYISYVPKGKNFSHKFGMSQIILLIFLLEAFFLDQRPSGPALLECIITYWGCQFTSKEFQQTRIGKSMSKAHRLGKSTTHPLNSL